MDILLEYPDELPTTIKPTRGFRTPKENVSPRMKLIHRLTKRGFSLDQALRAAYLIFGNSNRRD
jgi:hypothetical protein